MTEEKKKLNRHDFLCKYFAGDPEYYDTITNQKISRFSNVDWEKREYTKYNYDMGVEQTRKCYQKKIVTPITFISNLIKYVLTASVGMAIAAVALLIVYGVLDTIWKYAHGIVVSGEWIIISACAIGIIFIIASYAIYEYLANLKIETCIIGKEDSESGDNDK